MDDMSDNGKPVRTEARQQLARLATWGTRHLRLQDVSSKCCILILSGVFHVVSPDLSRLPPLYFSTTQEPKRAIENLSVERSLSSLC